VAEKDVTPDDFYASAAGDDAEKPGAPNGKSEATESNSSNYGGSGLAEKSIEDRVLHPPTAD